MPQLHPEQNILTSVRPTFAHEQRVVISANHAESHGIKGATGNNEQKVGAHLLRLERLFSKGPGVTERVWRSARDELLISRETVDSAADDGESFWRSHKQLLRDTGHGSTELTESMKDEAIDMYRMLQARSLEPWEQYFRGDGANLPLWFKLYSWDGMSSMGLIDRKNKIFKKRSAATAAAYPPFDGQALEIVFQALNEQDKKDKLQPANFNKLYTQALFDVKGVIPTPDTSDEVDGEWIKYGSQEKAELINAATVTPWCIAQEWAANRYLGTEHSEFVLFHLRNKATGQLSPTACASIRTDNYSQVREVSGLLAGQQTEPSLEATVMEKLASMEGGDRYAEELKFNNRLKVLDRVYREGRLFTLDELKDIQVLGRRRHWHDDDPRPSELAQSYYDRREEYEAQFGPQVVGYLVRDGDFWRNIADDAKLTRIAIEVMGPEFVRSQGIINYDAHDRSNPGRVLAMLVAGGLSLDDALADVPGYPRLEVLLWSVEQSFQLENDKIQPYIDSVRDYCQDRAIKDSIASSSPSFKIKFLSIFRDIGVTFDMDELVEAWSKEPSYALSEKNVWRLLQGGANPDTVFNIVCSRPDVVCPNLGLFVEKGVQIDPTAYARTLTPDEADYYKGSLIVGGVPKREIRRILGIPWYKRLG